MIIVCTIKNGEKTVSIKGYNTALELNATGSNCKEINSFNPSSITHPLNGIESSLLNLS